MTHQIPLRDWPLGLEEDALQLALPPTEITRRSKVTFARDHDSLDDFEGAVVDLGNGKSFALQHHLHSPEPGTTVLFEAGSTESLKEAIDFLKLRREEITWAAPHLEKLVEGLFQKRTGIGYALGLIGAVVGFGAGAAVGRFSARRASESKGHNMEG